MDRVARSGGVTFTGEIVFGGGEVFISLVSSRDRYGVRVDHTAQRQHD